MNTINIFIDAIYMYSNITIFLIFLLALLCLILNICDKKEHLDIEGVQNLISVYNDGNLLASKGTINNFTSTSMTASNIKGASATIKNNLQAETVATSEITSPKFCFDSTHCLDGSTFPSLMLASSDANQYMYLPNECAMYDDTDAITGTIITATPAGTLSKDWTGARTWNGKHLCNLVSEKNGNTEGFVITVPQSTIKDKEYTVLWVLLLADRFTTFSVNGSGMKTNVYGSGLRQLNNISPNGAIGNQKWDSFEWIPVPIKLSSSRKLTLTQFFARNGFPIAGIAFSTNPWAHCRVSSLMLWWSVNAIGASISVPPPANTTYNDSWNYDSHIGINDGKAATFRIPIVSTGRRKVIYLVLHNNFWSEHIYEASVALDASTQSVPITFSTSFDNPFSRHFNSKKFQRYVAGIIMPSFLGDAEYINVTISSPAGSYGIYIREMGTHDYNPFE